MNTRKRPQAECHPDRPHLAKNKCKPCYDKEYGRLNRARMTEKALEWQRNNPERAKAIYRKYNYGICNDEFEKKIEQQNGICDICNTKKATDVDHCHKTRVVRSILCGGCNRALGLFKEDPRILASAIDYMSKWNREIAAMNIVVGEDI